MTAGQVSDGYHTFNDLYKHRNALFVALAHEITNNDFGYVPDAADDPPPTNGAIEWPVAWKSKNHHPDDDPMYPGYFIACLRLWPESISYHLPLDLWDVFPGVEMPHAEKWDGCSPDATLIRLGRWIRSEDGVLGP